MGKYMRKSKASGEVAIMEVAGALLGVCTRSSTLAAQQQRAPSPSPSPHRKRHEDDDLRAGDYLELRSRRLEKQPPPGTKEKGETPPSTTRRAAPTVAGGEERAAAPRARARQIPRPHAPFFPLRNAPQPSLPHYSRDPPRPASRHPARQPATSPPPPPATGSSRGARRHGEVHAQEQGVGGGGRYGGRRRAARRPHPLPHPRRAAAARPLSLALAAPAPQGPGGRRPRGRRLPRAQEQAAREAAAAGAQGEGGRAAAGRRRREEVRAGGVVRGRGVRGRPRGLLRRQRAGLGRRREEHEGDDALQPDLQLGDDEHPRLRDQSQQQPVPPQAADAGLPLRPELARDGRVLRRRRATATPDLQGQVQLLPRERAPAPRTVRVGGARLLGLFPRATTTRSSSIDLCNTRMTTTTSSSSSIPCRGRDAKCSSVRFLIHLLL